MNCPKCGNAVPQGAPYCPVCNEPLPAAYTVPQQGFSQQQPVYPYPQQPQQPTGGYPPVNQAYQGYQGYQAPYSQQNYASFQQSPYPPGYQPPYVYGERQQPQNALMRVLSALPQAFFASFRSPADTLRSMLERNETLAFPLVLGVTLLLCFFCGMTLSRGFVEIVFDSVSVLTGVSLAGSASSMSQGAAYVAGRIAPAMGGVLALCQVMAMAIPGLVTAAYLAVVHKQRFSWPVLAGLMTVSSYPTIVAALLCMLASLIAPWLAVVFALCGITLSYVQLGAMLGFLTGRGEDRAFQPKAICLCLSAAVTLLAILLAGGSLMGLVLNNVLNLLSNVGALL